MLEVNVNKFERILNLLINTSQLAFFQKHHIAFPNANDFVCFSHMLLLQNERNSELNISLI